MDLRVTVATLTATIQRVRNEDGREFHKALALFLTGIAIPDALDWRLAQRSRGRHMQLDLQDLMSNFEKLQLTSPESVALEGQPIGLPDRAAWTVVPHAFFAIKTKSSDFVQIC